MAANYTIILFYKYTKIKDPKGFMVYIRKTCEELSLKGRFLIAEEGINGTLEGTEGNIKEFSNILLSVGSTPETKDFGNFSDIQIKDSRGTGSAFPKLKVKVRKEIVALGLGDEDFDPNKITGTHLKPEELKSWYKKGKDFVVLDMRNDFEYQVGRFKNSINPSMEYFRDLPKMLPSLEPLKNKTVLTVCTGGVRCEKASGYLKQKGFKDVYQLDGGMHKYMEAFPGEDFLGGLYTFDNRIVMDFGGKNGGEREIVGKCSVCQGASESFTHCGQAECHKHLICCKNCLDKKGRIFCSLKCNLKHKVKKLLGMETFVPVKLEN